MSSSLAHKTRGFPTKLSQRLAGLFHRQRKSSLLGSSEVRNGFLEVADLDDRQQILLISSLPRDCWFDPVDKASNRATLPSIMLTKRNAPKSFAFTLMLLKDRITASLD